ncbi:MAG: hypothetical protein GX237_09170 [Clostridiales bacterium]|nr:hypothetical protein [Clostridiales bacterium]
MHNVKTKSVSLNEVVVNDKYYKNAFQKELEYLDSLDIDRLLAGFREVKGLEAKAEVYPGWENTEIKGHTLGHYLAAISQAYASTNNPKLRRDIDYIVDELAHSQLDSGYLFASGEYLFDNVENSKPAWVPWYTMHKILEGIILAYEVTGNMKAYDVMNKLADWVYKRSSGWDEQLNLLVLKVEYGGMNDCLYDVYSHTGKKEHLIAAHKFDEIELFKEIYEGRDILCDLHANTTIPKFVGAMKRYMVVDDCEEFYLIAAQNFWDMVVNNHTYITGGNSEWEHFGKPNILDAERTNCNCETCNTYNMLKLSKGLYQITGEKKYLDFYDNTLTNAILSSQNPETGMTMYFQPMATGYFKVYSTPYDKFWCCTGTGMENFTKLNDAIYYIANKSNKYEVTIGRYVSSELTLEDMSLKIKMEANYPENEKSNITILEVGDKNDFVLKLRIPDWSLSHDIIDVGGSKEGITWKDGFVYIEREWSKGDVINITWKMALSYESLQDNPQAIAFKYGPVVLSASLGAEDMEVSNTGVDVTIPTRNMDIKDYLLIQGMTVEEWLDNIENHLVRKGDSLEFYLKNTDEDKNLVFRPHFRQYKERYGIYFNIFDKDSKDYQLYLKEKEMKRQLELATVDLLPVGNDQYELQHQVEGEKTFATTRNGYKCRIANPGGYFSYKMKVKAHKENEILIMLAKEGQSVDYEIYVDDNLIMENTTIGGWPPKVYEERILIPKDLVGDKENVTLRFVNKSSTVDFKLYGQLRMVSGTGVKSMNNM